MLPIFPEFQIFKFHITLKFVKDIPMNSGDHSRVLRFGNFFLMHLKFSLKYKLMTINQMSKFMNFFVSVFVKSRITFILFLFISANSFALTPLERLIAKYKANLANYMQGPEATPFILGSQIIHHEFFIELDVEEKNLLVNYLQELENYFGITPPESDQNLFAGSNTLSVRENSSVFYALLEQKHFSTYNDFKEKDFPLMKNFFARLKNNLETSSGAGHKISNLALNIVIDAHTTFVKTAKANLDLIMQIFINDREVAEIVRTFQANTPSYQNNLNLMHELFKTYIQNERRMKHSPNSGRFILMNMSLDGDPEGKEAGLEFYAEEFRDPGINRNTNGLEGKISLGEICYKDSAPYCGNIIERYSSSPILLRDLARETDRLLYVFTRHLWASDDISTFHKGIRRAGFDLRMREYFSPLWTQNIPSIQEIFLAFLEGNQIIPILENTFAYQDFYYASQGAEIINIENLTPEQVYISMSHFGLSADHNGATFMDDYRFFMGNIFKIPGESNALMGENSSLFAYERTAEGKAHLWKNFHQHLGRIKNLSDKLQTRLGVDFSKPIENVDDGIKRVALLIYLKEKIYEGQYSDDFDFTYWLTKLTGKYGNGEMSNWHSWAPIAEGKGLENDIISNHLDKLMEVFLKIRNEAKPYVAEIFCGTNMEKPLFLN